MSQLIDNLNIIESVKTDIKTAIENKGVDMTGVSFPGYASKIGEISGGGGWDQKSITEGNIEIINLDNSASFVASNAFWDNKNIQIVNLPYATSVGNNAFQNCSSLKQVDLPMCSYIGNGAFSSCSSLAQVNLPMCSKIDAYVFQRCSSLKQVDLPMCSSIVYAIFSGCSSLSQVSLPVCSYIGYNAFNKCSSLTQMSLPMCSKIDDYAFGYCSSLSIITIGYSSVCSLGGSNAFNNTLITPSKGSIYVPASLVDSYKSATNWSYFSTQIFPIE